MRPKGVRGQGAQDAMRHAARTEQKSSFSSLRLKYAVGLSQVWFPNFGEPTGRIQKGDCSRQQ